MQDKFTRMAEHSHQILSLQQKFTLSSNVSERSNIEFEGNFTSKRQFRKKSFRRVSGTAVSNTQNCIRSSTIKKD